MSSLDEPIVVDGTLCLMDLAVQHKLARAGKVERLDKGGGKSTFAVATDGRVCIPMPPSSEYAVWKLRVVRQDGARPVVQFHLRGGKVAGIVR